MAERLDEIRERLDAISKGTWRAVEEIDGVYARRRTVVQRDRLPDESAYEPRRIVTVGQTRPHDRNAENNVTFIAHAPEDVEFLLAEVDRLNEELERATQSNKMFPRFGSRYGW